MVQSVCKKSQKPVWFLRLCHYMYFHMAVKYTWYIYLASDMGLMPILQAYYNQNRICPSCMHYKLIVEFKAKHHRNRLFFNHWNLLYIAINSQSSPFLVSKTNFIKGYSLDRFRGWIEIKTNQEDNKVIIYISINVNIYNCNFYRKLTKVKLIIL